MTQSDAGAEPMNYPTGEAEILALPEAPRDAKLFTPLLAVGQILSASGEGGKTLVTAVKVVNGDGAWMKRTIDSSGEQP